jgi:hypothetical protein
MNTNNARSNPGQTGGSMFTALFHTNHGNFTMDFKNHHAFASMVHARPDILWAKLYKACDGDIVIDYNAGDETSMLSIEAMKDEEVVA